MAIWKDVPGYEGLYLVSDEGEILTLPRAKRIRGNGVQMLESRILKPAGKSKNSRQAGMYPHVNLMKDGVRKINHKDHNTWNNSVSNLEWCTRQYNNEYSNNKKVEQYTAEGALIAEYKSIKAAAESVGTSRGNITGALYGRQKTAVGCKWKFAEEV